MGKARPLRIGTSLPTALCSLGDSWLNVGLDVADQTTASGVGGGGSRSVGVGVGTGSGVGRSIGAVMEGGIDTASIEATAAAAEAESVTKATATATAAMASTVHASLTGNIATNPALPLVRDIRVHRRLWLREL